MIDITGLREDKRPQSSTIVHALLDRLEAAEADALEQARLNGMGSEREAALMTKLEAAEKERDDIAQQLMQSEIGKREISEAHDALQVEVGKLKDLEVSRCVKINGYIVDNARLAEEVERLQAKIEAMEKQEPVAWHTFDGEGGYDYRSYAMKKDQMDSLISRLQRPGYDLQKEQAIQEVVVELRRLNAERDECNRRRLEAADHFAAQTALMKEQLETLRAKIAEMEKQEPVAEIGQQYTLLFAGSGPITGLVKRHGLKIGDKLYALPGAQPAPSVPEGWLRAIDEALVTAHIGVANANDTYEQAKAKLDNLIGFNVDIATDPAVNGGWKLVPIEPTKEMIQKACSDHGYPHGDRSIYARGYRSMLAAAPNERSESPEVKP